VLWEQNTVASAKARNSVWEAALEANIPLLKDLPLVQTLDANLAGRYTDYSTSGSVQTWKVGLDYHINDDVRLRATSSIDIRAPTLNDLFSPMQNSVTGFTDNHTSTNGSLFISSQGNPGLKPPETDSYEIGYDYTHDKTSYDATVYYRALENAVSNYATDIGNGVILSRPVNSGHSRSGGAEFTVKRPLSKHWKGSFNANLFYNTMPLIAGGTESSRGAFRYSGNTALEFDPDNGDELQMVFTVTGRQLTVQGYVAATSRLDFTWKHDLTKKVALVVNLQDALAGMKEETVIDTPDLRGRTIQPANDRLIRIGLTRKFGGPKPKAGPN